MHLYLTQWIGEAATARHVRRVSDWPSYLPLPGVGDSIVVSGGRTMVVTAREMFPEGGQGKSEVPYQAILRLTASVADTSEEVTRLAEFGWVENLDD